jgi:SAM-dependent methyltransferase
VTTFLWVSNRNRTPSPAVCTEAAITQPGEPGVKTALKVTTVGLHDSQIELLACPVCGRGLEAEPRRLVCPAGHSFDRARSGYVNLMTGRPSRRVGDTGEMVRARARLLAAGHLEPLADAVAEMSARVTSRSVVELGTGTGYYLARTAGTLGDGAALGIDLSKHALAVAARDHPACLFVTSDVEERLPVVSGAADVALSVFAPRPAPELGRIVRNGGSLVVAAATESHLAGLRDRFGLLGVRPGKLPELEDRLAPGFGLIESRIVDYPIRLSAAETADAIAMGPSARHGAAGSGPLEDRVSVLLARFERRPR